MTIVEEGNEHEPRRMTGGERTSSSGAYTYTTSYVTLRDIQCYRHIWEPSSPSHDKDNDNGNSTKSETKTKTSTSNGLVVLYHGFLAHGAYPTVRYAAEFFAAAHFGNYTVVSYDLPGHGLSAGLAGYLPSAEELIALGVAMVEDAQHQSKDPDRPLILCGSSMGGTIALAVAHTVTQQQETAAAAATASTSSNSKPPLVILLAPMLQLKVSSLERFGLQCLARVAPTMKLIPSTATDLTQQYRDAHKRQECADDTAQVAQAQAALLSASASESTTHTTCTDSIISTDAANNKKIRVGSALTCVDLTWHIAAESDKITVPYLLLVADDDVVVQNTGAEYFHTHNAATDRTLVHYPALHGLLCEPAPLFATIQTDILQWLAQRV